MQLHGRPYTRREIEARVGRMEQIGGIRRMTLAEGNETGTSVIAVTTGAGLAYEVTPDKGLDISAASFAGASLAWQSANGDAHPSYYDDQGTAWLRTAAGGLFMTCGLMNVGSPGTVDGVAYGQHGRAHHTPAKQVSAESVWCGDELELRVRGVLEETSMFGGHLRLRREIRSRAGENAIMISDTVENAGFRACPHMMLYHFNFGYPLMTEETRLTFPGGRVAAREAEVPVDGYDRWEPPNADYAERVYYHELPQTADGWAEVAVKQERFPLGGGHTAPMAVRLAWTTDTLPRLVQWKMPGAGVHALGIEPANCGVEGMAVERERGTLRMLEPGETVHYELKLTIG
ncbi:aldose 1-epimerase family protein [Paenibacillus lycopersici]|uniref:Aldose 1-epimerase family protein n=1 Tax=Paenibacillus lycopersici TaxID=2704462 RepID=A0A6C0FRT0_9BACL|nr:aldose 1-epimerase family protein [Paenibacillus lycopersici]QHT59577.1 aldose 1-epimerase family protein [Paenibacillus lycopersici]